MNLLADDFSQFVETRNGVSLQRSDVRGRIA